MQLNLTATDYLTGSNAVTESDLQKEHQHSRV